MPRATWIEISIETAFFGTNANAFIFIACFSIEIRSE